MTNTPSTIVGANIRAEMARRGISQAALALKLGKSQAAVSARLRGITPVDVNELDVIAGHLGVDPASLLTEPMGASA
jgi:transcriptional regulator with XRE-family HTH domain